MVLDNSDDYSGSIYSFYDDLAATSWVISVTSKVPGSLTRSIATPRMKMKVQAGEATTPSADGFPAARRSTPTAATTSWTSPTSSRAFCPISASLTRWNSTAAPGFDRVPLSDLNAAISSPGVKVYANKFAVPVASSSGATALTPTTLGIHSIEDTSIRLQQTSTVSIQSWGDQKLTVEGNQIDLYTGYVVKDASVQIENTPKIAVIEFPAVPNHTGMGIDKDGPYIGRPLSYSSYDPLTRVPMVAKTRFNYDNVTTSVDFYGLADVRRAQRGTTRGTGISASPATSVNRTSCTSPARPDGRQFRRRSTTCMRSPTTPCRSVP